MSTLKPKVSVVTVCYNALHQIEKTIKSVLSQSSCEYEYIIIDGASSDGTYELIKSYENRFERKKIKYVHVSEADDGIYHAMNKSVKYCSGDWVIFMNAGDFFYSENIISDLFSQCYDKKVAVLYGGVVKFDTKRNIEIKELPNDIEVIYKCMPFCHQSSFVRLSDFNVVGFDPNFKIAADYDFFLRLYLQGKMFLKIDCYISYFELNGISSNNDLALYDDFLNVKHKHGIVNKNSLLSRAKRHFYVLRESYFKKI